MANILKTYEEIDWKIYFQISTQVQTTQNLEASSTNSFTE